ncbi:HNH endonuclease signature motif containing protein [Granulosicoccaceae sp. 1_MG-2023]|nr:HNH endonuclease signature motif containing protein [Granulosicoccaceae sp. 1_MG-2023]
MGKESYIEFIGDDQAYLNWVADNPQGYVVNALASKGQGYRVLHNSSCSSVRHLSSAASEGGFTERAYIKICASSVEALKRWSFDHGATSACFSKICKVCFKEDEFRQELAEFARSVEQALRSDARARRERLDDYDGVVSATTVEARVYSRNPEVVAETLLRAGGVCEACFSEAPFRRKSDNSPYLEVHHVTPLSEGGLDLLSNTKALCPNCHRKAHFG